MNLQRAAEIQVVLEGVSLPATRDELVRYAALQDAEAAVELERIPDREYGWIDEVGAELAATGPLAGGSSRLPRPESGEQPGGDDYLKPFPEPGQVRHDAPRTHPPQEVLEEQSKTQKRQKAAQEG
jgi:Protein of unknown function (DUF2795)